MKRFILEGPDQLVEAIDASSHVEFPHRRWRRVVLLGMGGSALGGGLVDLLRYVQNSSWEWHVVRDYRIHFELDEQTLVFALSYSGNTEEMLATFEQAVASPAFVVAVSAGGELEQAARANDVPWVCIPPKAPGFQPRFALYFMLGTLYHVLVGQGLLNGVEDLPSLASWLKELDLEEQGKELAKWLGPAFPVIYSPPAFETGVARTWRIKFNENSKLPAIAGALPEANHNEMIAFTPQFAGHFSFFLLTSPGEHPRIVRRFQLLRELLTESGYGVKEVPLTGDNVLRKALSSLLLADWVSYYAAVERQTDPIAIPAIQNFKKDL